MLLSKNASVITLDSTLLMDIANNANNILFTMEQHVCVKLATTWVVASVYRTVLPIKHGMVCSANASQGTTSSEATACYAMSTATIPTHSLLASVTMDILERGVNALSVMLLAQPAVAQVAINV